jgi:hypothetical protein
MNPTIFSEIITRLNADTTLMTLMGKTVGDNPCYRAQRLSAIVPPAITLRANTESGDLYCGTDYVVSTPVTGAALAQNRATIQVDIWVSSSNSSVPSTGFDTDAIANQVDILLLYNTPAHTGNTHGWRKVGSSQQYEDETGLWHNVIRYEFWYLTKQGYGLT